MYTTLNSRVIATMFLKLGPSGAGSKYKINQIYLSSSDKEVHVPGKGKRCKYLRRWVCDGEIICAEDPCISKEGMKSCPKDFYLCENQCKPEFLACNKSCYNNGFYCEKQIENIIVPTGNVWGNITANTFDAFDYKRKVRLDYLAKYDMSSEEYRKYLHYVVIICSMVYNSSIGSDELNGEKCCLPMNFRCDGTIECYNGNESVSFIIIDFS